MHWVPGSLAELVPQGWAMVPSIAIADPLSLKDVHPASKTHVLAPALLGRRMGECTVNHNGPMTLSIILSNAAVPAEGCCSWSPEPEALQAPEFCAVRMGDTVNRHQPGAKRAVEQPGPHVSL